ncbi:hypothetical protein Hanom_Chr17g01590111 [Helianthus anomalus]
MKKEGKRSNLSFSRRSTTKIPHMNLTTFSIHHDSNSIPFLLIQPPHFINHALVPLTCPMTHINPSHIHPPNSQRLQLLEPTCRRSDRAHQLRPPRAPEPVLLQLRLRHRIHLDRTRRY